MKRCPTCDKTFPDAMKFCQTDGTLLIGDAPAADPYKTVIGNQSDVASSTPPPLDPFKTMVATPPRADEDILQLPDDQDSLKTMIVSRDELLGESQSSGAADVPPLEIPPPPAPPIASAPLIEPKPASPKEFAPPPPPAPKYDEPLLSPPSFGDLAPPASDLPKFDVASGDAPTGADSNVSKEDAPPSPFDSKPAPRGNKPIPSPFDGSMIGYMPPAAPPPLDLPKPPPFKEAEKPFDDYQEPAQAPPSPFQPPSPFESSEPFNQPLQQQSEWTPPPAPVSEWQNQDLGANTPFQPPGATAGQDQTLAIVSLVCGILGILCCGLLTGIPAIVTGYMAKNNVDSNPNQYGGRGLAVAGMILGGVSILFSILGIIYYAIVLASASF